MTFEFTRATRQDIPLLIGIAGPTGGGKTMSALRLAKGLAGEQPFAFIDTEAGRALHYADEFAFDHGMLAPPFEPERYWEAIHAADEKGYPVIVVDSMSHEHAGDGGLLDMHEDILQQRAGDDFRRRETLTMAAWVEPKRRHKAMVSRLLQVRSHLILCLRAESKIEMAKEGGKTVIRPKQSLTGHDGWIPISEKSLPFELTMSLLVTPDAPGVPKPIKLNQAHRLILPLDQPVSEESGVALGAWAKGQEDERAKRVADLSAQLLGCADELGVRDEVTAAIQKNRRFVDGDLGEHATWLQGHLDRAREQIERKAPEDLKWGNEPEPEAAAAS